MSSNILASVGLSLEDKVALAEEVITKAYIENDGRLFCSWSGGKDSQVLMHIALRLYPDLKVAYSNTTNEMKEILDHVRTFPNIITVFPARNFKTVIREIGFPLVSKEVSQKSNELKTTNGYRTRMLRHYGNNKGDSKLPDTWQFLADQPFDVSSKCCQILKKDPLEKWAKENGNLKPLIGLMSGESRLRQQLALYGKEGGKKIYPFLRTGWTEQDIWAYAEKHGLRFAECYYDRWVDGVLLKAVDRSGCDSCHYGKKEEREIKFARSRALSPKKHAVMMKQTNNGVSFEEAMSIADEGNSSQYLGLFGGIVRGVEIKNNKEIYDFDIVSDVHECPCCGKRGTKSKVKLDNFNLGTSFVDTPNPLNGKKRIINTNHCFYECLSCGMSLNNNMHLFDQRFRVTKRVIDYIYENMDKKEELEISEELGLDLDTVFEVMLSYENIFKKARANNQESVWFDENNNIVRV